MLNPRTNRRPLTRVSRFRILAGLALASMLVGSLPVAAQTARLAVTIVDQAGNAVPHADLQLGARGIPEELQVSSDENGRFEFTDLEPREYSLFANAPGFDRLLWQFALEAGAQIEQELVLPLSHIEETVTIRDTFEAPPPVSTMSADPLAQYVSVLAGATSTPVARSTMRPDSLEWQRGNRTGDGTVGRPIKIREQNPVYPESVRGSGFEGEVVLEGLVKTDGTVEVLKVLAPVDPVTMTMLHPDLARSAVEAIGGWRYDPTLLGGVPVDTRIRISVNFEP